MIFGLLEYIVIYKPLLLILGGNEDDDSSVQLLFSKSPEYSRIPIERTNASLIDTTKDLYIIIHGFNEKYDYYLYTDLARTLTSIGANVICVDWYELGKGMNYIRSTKNIGLVANVLAKYILSNKLDPSKVKMVGFSLGAHIAGLTGKQLKCENLLLGKIYGLDPAGPMFGLIEPIPEEYRLAKTDAKHVATVASNQLFFGTRFGLGKVNFISNGGSIQPGCFLKEFPPFLCSHRRALPYFNYSLVNNNFVGRNAFGQVILGKDDDATGTYWFATDSNPPYAKG